MAEFPEGEGARYQPEFSPGERLATLEAGLARAAEDRTTLQAQMDRRLGEAEKLFNEKLDGLRRELAAVNTAQKDAVAKSETSQQRQFGTFVEASDRKAEIVAQRLAALEQTSASSESGRRAVGELKTSTVAYIAAIATIILAFVSLAANHII